MIREKQRTRKDTRAEKKKSRAERREKAKIERKCQYVKPNRKPESFFLHQRFDKSLATLERKSTSI